MRGKQHGVRDQSGSPRSAREDIRVHRRQATNKIAGISDAAAAFLNGFFV
jgi:hypothetical protein